ncbi:MAG: ferrochelatase [Luteitalea sp.]|nr:ferrochelatase [Luteitalea sp.]
MASPVMPRPFDAVLVVAFGGPERIEDIRPFLANVLRGRRVPGERVEEVAKHYELFDGRSPLTEITRRQAEGLRVRLKDAGIDLPVYVGMRNWHPLLSDTLAVMARDGVRRAIGVICAAHRSYSSCTQYRQNVNDARGEAVGAGLRDVQVTYVSDWHTHDGFVGANARHIVSALRTLSPDLREVARIVFTAHSIPESMTGAARYRDQLLESARLVAARAGSSDWALVFQSRSGRPEDPWLGPDVTGYLRAERAAGLEAAVLCPIGFVCDHIEVLYDLDHEAAEVCEQIGLPMVRALAVNDDPAFLETLRDAAIDTWRRYERGTPLTIAPSSPPERIEGPAPSSSRRSTESPPSSPGNPG